MHLRHANPSSRTHRGTIAAACVAVLLTPAIAAGQCDGPIAVWNGVSGSMLDPSRWADGVLPGADDTLLFDTIPFTTAELIDGELAAGRLRHRGGALTLELQDATLTLTSGTTECAGLMVGGPSTSALVIESFSFAPGWIVADSASIGTTDGAGLVVGENFGSGKFDIAGALSVGDSADGTIEDIDAIEAASVTIGRDGRGRIDTVEMMSIAGELTVGDGAIGELLGTSFVTDDLTIGGRRSGFGYVETAGNFDHLVLGNAEVGSRGVGYLLVGRDLEIGGDLRVGVFQVGKDPGYFDRGDGTVEVGGQLTIGGDFDLGIFGHAHLDIDTGGRVDVSGSLEELPNFETDRGVSIILGAAGEPGSDDPIIDVGTTAILPPLTVRLDSGLTPDAGDRWTLVRTGESLDVASLALEVAPRGLTWIVTETPTELRVELQTAGVASADINGDGIVDFGDLLIVLGSFGLCPDGGPCPADVDGNDVVDFNDLLAVLSEWD